MTCKLVNRWIQYTQARSSSTVYLQCGAPRGFVVSSSSAGSLAQSIRDIMAGKVSFDQELFHQAIAGAVIPGAGLLRRKFTDRERQVLSYVFEGLANKEIAAPIGVSESSVKATLQQLFAKTGVRTRSQLVRIALERYKHDL